MNEMTAKEKANELVGKFMFLSFYFVDGENGARPNAIFCAKQCVDEIIDAIDWHEFETPNKQINFWLDVRKELNQM
jgi:hypothetical protein